MVFVIRVLRGDSVEIVFLKLIANLDTVFRVIRDYGK